MEEKQRLKEWPSVNEAWKIRREDKLVLPNGMVIRRIERVPTFGTYKEAGLDEVRRIFLDELRKVAKIETPLLPHQQRVVERMQKEDQPGLVVAHGLGSGKTLTSIAVQEALKSPSTVVVPASLRSNYLKELKKHVKGRKPKADIQSLQAITRHGQTPEGNLLIVDEAHRLRDPTTKGYHVLGGTHAGKRLLLTGTPLYNRPFDLASLINIAAGKKVLPSEQKKFESQFITEERVSPGILNWLRGVRSGVKASLNPKTKEQLGAAIHKWVDYHPGMEKEFPSVKREDVKVPMTSKQRDIYDTMMNKAPFWVRAKVRMNLPLSKSESKQINAFLAAARQVSNTTGPFDPGPEEHPKIDAAVGHLKKHLKSSPRGGALVYSNYLDAGINPLKRRLEKEGIPYGEISGVMKKRDRDEAVRRYNEGQLRTLLLSSAGGEGLDLKGTRLIQIMEPHWNEEKLRQVEGRGIRFGSHSHLPPSERNVRVQHFLATKPKSGFFERIGLSSPGHGVDEYLKGVAEDKARLNQQLRELFQQK